MSPSNTSEKTFPGNLPDVFEKIFFQLSKLSNFDVEVTSCDTWGVVNLGSITFGSYPQKKTQDARIPKSPAVPQPFFRCRETPQPRTFNWVWVPFSVDPKMVASQKTWWAPGRKHPPNRKAKSAGFSSRHGFPSLVHLFKPCPFAFSVIFVFWGAKSFPAVHGMGLFFPPKN